MATGIRDKVALITGAASGIGRVTAQVFAKEGAHVIVATDANLLGAEETVRMIRETGGDASFVQCDISSASDVERLVKSCVESYGQLDFAFNNAGVGPDGKRIPVLSIVDCTEEIWDRTIDINLKGAFLCLKYEIRQMLKQGRGSIVNTSSAGAYRPARGFCAYDASKTGLLALTRVAALEYGASGIRVNAVCPAPTERTLLFENLTSASPENNERMTNAIPLKRLAQPEDIAQAVVWLCSDEASFITGHIMAVDGGMSAS